MGGKNSQIQAYGKTVREERDADILKWKKIMADRRKELGISKELQEQIYMSLAHQLADLLNKGKVTSRQILTVLAYRSTTVAHHFNHITEIDFQVADRAAQICDQERKRTGKKNWTFNDPWDLQKFFPPLYGIPTSVKDVLDQKGKRTTMGVTRRAHDIKDQDGGMVACLRAGGLIPFIRTNVSQMTMSSQANNFLYGRSLNVWNADRNIGGSSGGQGGVLSAFCTPIGVGSDIGGSLRIPAEYNGICSIRPCFQRISVARSYSTNYPDIIYGKDTVFSVIGPMARSVQDLALWLKTVCQERFHVQPDPFQRMVEFNIENFKNHAKKKLKIGYVKSYPVLQSSPASQRAVDEVVALLKSQGHQLVPVQIPNVEQMCEQYMTWYSAEGNFQSLQEFLQGEQEAPSFKLNKKVAKSRILFCIANSLTKCLAPRTNLFLKTMKQVSVTDYCKHHSRVYKLREDFVKWWKSLGLDNIVTAGLGCQPNTHDIVEDVVPTILYTFIWNLLNMPSGALPVTLVKEDEQHYQTQHNDMLASTLRRNAAGSVGLPVGVQIVGLPFEEEKVLSVMNSLESKINFQKFRKCPNVEKE